jgi:hypothetical protein
MSESQFRTAATLNKLPDLFGRNEDIPEDLIGAKIVLFGTFKDNSLVDGGGLVIDYQPINSDETRRVVFAFDETAMWLAQPSPEV